MRKAEEKMLAAVKNDLNTRFKAFDQSKLHIGAAGAGLPSEEETQWLDILKKEFPNIDIMYLPLSDSISVHTGSGAVDIGICFR